MRIVGAPIEVESRSGLENGRGPDAALAAWRECGFAADGLHVERVHDKEKSTVYRLTGPGLAPVVAKRSSAATAAIESAVYERVLPRLPVPSIRCLGRLGAPSDAWVWLFLEEADGEPYAYYEAEHRTLVARWLGALHAASTDLAEAATLPDRGPAYFRARLAAARGTVIQRLSEPELAGDDRLVLERAVEQCELLAARWPELEAFCEARPRTLVHGDLAALNLRLRTGTDAAVRAFDWEKAGFGVPVVDFIRDVDLPTYWSIVRTRWPRCTAEDLDVLVRYAKIVRPLTHNWARKPIAKIAAYHAHMADAIGALGWRRRRGRRAAAPAAARAVAGETDVRTSEADRAKRRAYRSRFPELDALVRGLSAALVDNGSGTVTILSREPNVYRSTSPSEVVACCLPDGSERIVLCKYGVAHRHEAYGHRAGSAYEAAVYEHVLAPAGVRPAFFGRHVPATGETWFFIEYLHGALRLDRTEVEPIRVMAAAARWAGRFHASGAFRLGDPSLGFLNRYDGDYYAGWARRAAAFSRPLHGRHPWLPGLCEGFEEVMLPLLTAGHTIIHGECTVHNVLAHGTAVYAIDWESAAVAPGEIDLAALLEGWSEPIEREIETAYNDARWGGAPPPDAEQRLVAARVYWALRWLGERPDWTLGEKNAERYPRLHRIAEQSGLL